VEHVLGGLVRARTVSLVDDSFEKEGTVVAFQRVYLAVEGGDAARSGEALAFRMPMAGSSSTSLRERKRERGKGRRTPDTSRRPAKGQPSAKSPASADALFQALRAWRLAEAKRTGLPAFRILTDRTLLAIAAETPGDENALLRVHGIGPALAKRYGSAVLGIVARYPAR
jgi:superfamily II DNA helicase RecQ